MKQYTSNDNNPANNSTTDSNNASSVSLEKSLHHVFHMIYLKNRNSGQQTQGKVLKILYRKGTVSQKEVQDFLDVKPGTISEIITKLEKKGLLTRIQDINDRRKVLLSLTEKGRMDVEAFNQNYQNNVMSYFNILTEGEKNEFTRILNKILNQEGIEKKPDWEADKSDAKK